MKKTISILLAFIILITPISVFAYDDDNSDYIYYFTEDVIIGNIWDTKVNFRLDRKEGLLTIYGTGKMSDCDKGKYFQRFDYGREGCGFNIYSWYNEIVDVVIKDGVTDIMSFCFRDCENLKTITIPSSVTDIGSDCFSYCDSLTDIYYTGTISQWNKVEKTGFGWKYDYEKGKFVGVDPAIHIMGSKTGWVNESKKTYYLTDEHLALYGLQKIDSKEYIFKKTTGELLKGKVSCDGYKYITSKTDGRILYGKVRCDNKYYIAHKKTGMLIYGPVQCDGKKYIMNTSSGEMLYGKVKYKNKYYIASKKDGHLFLNSKVKCDGKTYYTDKNGAVKKYV